MKTMFKRITAASVLLLLGAASVQAQDLIVKRDSSRVEARVMEIGTQEVRYKRFSNPDGPMYVLPVEQIEYIAYKNGERDTFVAPQPPSAPVVPTVPVESAPVAYKVGDYYEKGDVKGIVFRVTDQGRHGLILSLVEAEHYMPWSTLREPSVEVGASSNTDGELNMRSVERFIAAGGAGWEDFPAFKWCRDLGEGWYLPAVDELLHLAHNFNGGQRMVFDRKARQHFNDTIREHGGKRIDRMVDYFSSTEQSAQRAKSAHMAVEPPYVNDMPKHQKYLVRAVRKF